MDLIQQFQMNKVDIVQAGVDAYLGKSRKAEFSVEDRKNAVVEAIKKLGENGGFRLSYRREMAFAIVTEVLDKVVTEDVRTAYDAFIEIKKFANKDIPEFIIKNKKIKAYNVAVGGTVQRHRIDGNKARAVMENLQVAVYDELERIINGDCDWNELIDSAKEALQDALYEMIFTSLASVFEHLPSNNKAESAGFDKAMVSKIINTINMYGDAVIMGTPRAVSAIPLDTHASEADKLDIRNQGYVGMYQGCKVIKMENAYKDETNEELVLPDENLYIVPSGKEKIVRVAFQGDAVSRLIGSDINADWTETFEMYFKVGIVIPQVNHIGIFKNSSLK